MTGGSARRAWYDLAAVSVALLFLEIALIRWIATEVRIFAYLSNLVLLACFVGMGGGCYGAARRCRFGYILPLLTLLVCAAVLPWKVVIAGRSLHPVRDIPAMVTVFTESPVWGHYTSDDITGSALFGLAATLAVFALIAALFYPLGQRLGVLLDRTNRPILAYSVNVAASIAGVWLFGLLSLWCVPPAVWFVLATALIVLTWPSRRHAALGVLCAAVMVAVLSVPEPRAIERLWSPYQKLVLHPCERDGLVTGYGIAVNNAGYMQLLDLSDTFIAAHPAQFPDGIVGRTFCHYDLPYRLRPAAQRVLILGAGAGNDAAGALRAGVRQVDAVEIDPGIFRLGRQYHPAQPYADSRVQVHIDDARAFLRRAQPGYDVVTFGLLDAHTSASAYNNTRLDHYIYTREALAQAAALLAPDGVLTLVFESHYPWLTDRFYGMLRDVFGYSPLMVFARNGNRYGWGGTMFICPRDPAAFAASVRRDPALSAWLGTHWQEFAGTTAAITDDWPYLYLPGRRLPPMYLLVSAALLLLAAAWGGAVLRRAGGMSGSFFCLGAAFMLLEFQNISKSSLLFGATWVVSAVTITAILVLILFANLLVARRPLRDIRTVYLLLFASLAVLYALPLELLTSLSPLLRLPIAGFCLNLPIVFAGIIFIDAFARTRNRAVALGSNFLGAVVGGLLESLSFVTGVHFLVVLTLALYLLALLWRERSGDASPAASR